MTEHGKWHKYNRGCRCEPCKAAALEYRRAWRERKRSLMLAGDPSVPHGTTRGYGDWSCRCDRCCAASDAYNEARRRAKGIEPKRVASDEELSEAVHLARLHGTKVAAERTGWNASTIYQWSRRLGIEPLHREAQHGSRTMYGHYGCRCDPCREAQNTYMKERRLKGIVPAGATHGKASTYANYGCRCDACLAAGSDANRRGRESRLRIPNVLRRAANILTEAGWCQHQLRDEHGRVCAQGAVERAVIQLGGSVVGNVFADAMRTVDTVVVVPRHVPPGERVRWFNDKPGRTLRQVRGVLLRAAASADVDDKGAGMSINNLSERAAS